MAKRLTRITTRAGDRGDTHLADGSSRRKSHARIEAIGAVDELNAQLGALLAMLGKGAHGDAHEEVHDDPVAARLAPVQHRLFDLGGALSLPGHGGLATTAVAALEHDVEALNAQLPPLENFVLPGGGRAAAQAHVVRTVCRRAERTLIALADAEPDADDATLAVYLNRLSDLLFVAGRHLARRHGGTEVLWEQPEPPRDT